MDDFRILLVDDEGDFVFALAERLSLRGFQVEAATNAEDALSRLRGGDFRVVVLDVKMPGLGGLALMSRIKREGPAVQVILLTGHGSVADAKRGLEEGAFDYLTKPIDIDELIAKIQKAAA